MKRKNNISCVILTYNEAHRLRDCLRSAVWADEIVVIDGHSSDETAAIAKEFTKKVVLSDRLGPQNPGGFSAQRNFGLEQASGEWVFFLDADERFTPELAEEIQELCINGIDKKTVALRVRRREHFFGVHSPYTHSEGWQTRLVRKGFAIWDGRLVHEGLILQGDVESLKGYLLHFSKDSIADYVATQNRYTSLEAEQAVHDGKPLPRSPWKEMVKTFLNIYIYRGSYREGAFGMIMSLLFTQCAFLCWAKRWEMAMKSAQFDAREPRFAWCECGARWLGKLWRIVSPPAK